jgi:hypothetical protein
LRALNSEDFKFASKIAKKIENSKIRGVLLATISLESEGEVDEQPGDIGALQDESDLVAKMVSAKDFAGAAQKTLQLYQGKH